MGLVRKTCESCHGQFWGSPRHKYCLGCFGNTEKLKEMTATAERLAKRVRELEAAEKKRSTVVPEEMVRVLRQLCHPDVQTTDGRKQLGHKAMCFLNGLI